MEEPVLSSGKEPSDFAYRFLWLRTFHHPIAIRVQRTGSSTILRGVELDGRGGYDWGKIVKEVNRELPPAEVEAVVTQLDKAGFWQMEPREDPSRTGLDGAIWILEGSQNGAHREVIRWCPKSGDVREICLSFLPLAGLTVLAKDIY
jgi:hypothetical protein